MIVQCFHLVVQVLLKRNSLTFGAIARVVSAAKGTPIQAPLRSEYSAPARSRGEETEYAWLSRIDRDRR